MEPCFTKCWHSKALFTSLYSLRRYSISTPSGYYFSLPFLFYFKQKKKVLFPFAVFVHFEFPHLGPFAVRNSVKRAYDGLLLDAAGTLLQLSKPVEETYASIGAKHGQFSSIHILLLNFGDFPLWVLHYLLI